MTIKKTIISLLLICFVQISLADPLVIRFSHDEANDSPKGVVATKFQQLVKERIGDDVVVVQVFPDSQLFSRSEELNALEKGEVELIAPSVSHLESLSSRFKLFDLPFIFANRSAAQKFVEGEYGKRMLNIIKSDQIRGFGYLIGGMRQLSSNKLMTIPSDIQGLKIAVRDSIITKGWLQSIGAEPAEHHYSEVYKSISEGAVDGQINTWSKIYSEKIYEQQNYIVETNHSFLTYAVIGPELFWKRVPENLSKELGKALEDAITYGNIIANQIASTHRQLVLYASKSRIYELSLDQRQAWTEAMLPAWNEFENEIGSGLIQAAASQR